MTAATPLSALEDSRSIAAAVRTMARALRTGAIRYRRVVGFPGGSVRLAVFWNNKHGFWSGGFYPVEGTRYWCCFGTQDPATHRALHIDLEINPPLHGIDRRCKGVLAKDAAGSVHLLHTGGIGGGIRGLTRAKFLRAYRGPRRAVRWSDGKTWQCPWFGPVNGISARLGPYVHAAHRFKRRFRRAARL